MSGELLHQEDRCRLSARRARASPPGGGSRHPTRVNTELSYRRPRRIPTAECPPASASPGECTSQVDPRVSDTVSERQQPGARLRQHPGGCEREPRTQTPSGPRETTGCGACGKPPPWGATLPAGQQLHGSVERRQRDSEREKAAVCRRRPRGPPTHADVPAGATHSAERSADSAQHHEQVVDRPRQPAA